MALHGTVSQRDGQAIAGALIVILPRHESSPLGASTRSSTRGTWSVPISPKAARVLATAPGYAPRVVPIEAGATFVRVVLEPHDSQLVGTVYDATGGVISGARVKVRLERSLPWWPTDYSSETDDRGKYSIALPPRTVSVAVEHQDYVSQKVRLAASKGKQSRDFLLLPAGVIAGRTLSQEDGRPVPGATVSTASSTTISDAYGNFELRGLPSGRVQLTAHAPRHASEYDLVVSLALAEQRSGLEIFMVSAADVEGTVVDASNDIPIENATIELLDNGIRSRKTLSDKEGRFVLQGVLEGTQSLMVHRDDCGNTLIPLESTAEQVITVDCGTWIHGRVSPATQATVTGRPPETAPLGLLAGASMSVDRSTTTDEEGSFWIGPLHGPEIILDAKGEDGSEGRLVVHTSSVDDEVEIRLEERHSLSGILVGSTGQPLPHAVVEATEFDIGAPEDEAIDLLASETSVTDAEGHFEIRGLASSWHRVSVFDEVGQHLRVIEPTNGKLEISERSLGGITLVVEDNSASISGRVRSADGDVHDVWVQAIWAGDRHRFVKIGNNLSTRQALGTSPRPVLVDGDGEFSIGGLRPGNYQVEAYKSDNTAFATADNVHTGDPVLLELELAGRIIGKVTDAKSVEGPIRIDVGGETELTLSASRSSGAFEIEGLRAGEYTVFASRPGETTGLGQVVRLESGAETHVAMELVSLTTVRGQLLDENDLPLQGVTVVSRFLGQTRTFRPSSTITAANGDFTLHAPAGPLLLVAYGYPRHVHRATVSGSDAELGQLEPISSPVVVAGPAE